MEGKMKALVMEQYCEFKLKEWEMPCITDSQVLVKVRAVSICGSDVGGSDGKSGRRIPPIIMGHEASGEIVELGAGVKNWQVGQRVTFDSTEYCSECFFCRKGQINLCDNRKVLGVSCDEYRRHGAMAEYVAIEAKTLYALPEHVTYEEAALVEPLSIGVHAVAVSPLCLGDTVLIHGCGTIGLMILQAVKARGGSQIIVSDLDEDRLNVALQMGAHYAINSKDTDVPERVRELIGDRGVDIVFDAVGIEPTIRSGIFSLRKGGCLVAVGNLSKEIQFPIQYCITRQIRIQGSCASSGEYDTCLAMIASKQIDLTPFLSNSMPLEQGELAFQRLYNKEPNLLKVILINNNP